VNEVIASTKVIAVHADGKRDDITIEVGKPYLKQSGEGFEEWACPVSLRPLFDNLAEARGGGPFQSLCMASSLILGLLSGVKEKGGKLLIDENNEFPLEAYLFGKK